MKTPSVAATVLLILIYVQNFELSCAETYVNTCLKLKEAMTTYIPNNIIIITANIRCTRDIWGGQLYLASDVTIEGSKYTATMPSLDWADSTDILALAPNVALTFQGLILMQDFMGVGGISFSFIKGNSLSSLSILGVGVAIRSCFEPITLYEESIRRLARAKSGEQSVESNAEGLLVSDISYYLSEADLTYIICGTWYQCDLNTPQDINFILALQSDKVRPYCNAVVSYSQDTGDISVGESIRTDTNTNMGIVVALTAICTIVMTSLLFIIILKVLIPYFLKTGLETKKQDTKNLKTRDIEMGNKDGADGSAMTDPKEENKETNAKKENIMKSIALTEIEMGVPLGKGAYGTVYKAYFRGMPIALKVIDMDNRASIEKSTEIIQNYLVQKVNHNNLVKIYLYENLKIEDMCETSNSLSMDPQRQITSTYDIFNSMDGSGVFVSYRTFVVMEFCNMGSLAKAIREKLFLKRDIPKWPYVLRSAFDISRALDYLHSRHIVHGDLKPENVLLRGDASDCRGFICKVGDFGLSRFLSESTAVSESPTFRSGAHTAPELAEHRTLGKEADVFSFGMLLLRLITEKNPYEDFTSSHITKRILSGSRPDIPQYTPKAYTRLIKDCWHDNYRARPPFELISERLARMISEFGTVEMETPRDLEMVPEEKASDFMDTTIIRSDSEDASSIVMTNSIMDSMQSQKLDSPKSIISDGENPTRTFSFKRQVKPRNAASLSQEMFKGHNTSSDIPKAENKVRHESLTAFNLKEWAKLTNRHYESDRPSLQDDRIEEVTEYSGESQNSLGDTHSSETPKKVVEAFDSLPRFGNNSTDMENEDVSKDAHYQNLDDTVMSKPSPTVSLKFGMADDGK